jgi:uncharacterized protein (DUF1499 family)
MRTRRRVLAALIALLAAGCSAETTELDLRTMARRGGDNEFLACPPDYCAARADATAPVFPVPAARLRGALRAVLADQPRLTILREDALDAGVRVVAVQRSLVFRFPDTVWIEIVPRGTQSTLAIYSRSAYGRSDFGVNRARVEQLLAALGAAVAAMPAR